MTGHRWSPINSTKNSPVTIQIHCTLNGKRFDLPSTAADDSNELVGSTSLQELVRCVKKYSPGLYLCDEIGGQILTCGSNTVYQSEWDNKMICDLISQENEGTLPRVVLEDGREAIVITIGTPESNTNAKQAVVHRCLKKGDTYG